MNRFMTGGQDIHWREQVIRLARLKQNACLLDIGTGTGDLAREALAQFPQAKIIAADFTLEMMRVGRNKGALTFSSADALQLPFRDALFDAVVSGFLMRNVINLQNASQEKYFFAAHTVSHACRYPSFGSVDNWHKRSVSLSTTEYRRICHCGRISVSHGSGWIQEDQL
jgi:SAM-dependent methyltransferase